MIASERTHAVMISILEKKGNSDVKYRERGRGRREGGKWDGAMVNGMRRE